MNTLRFNPSKTKKIIEKTQLYGTCFKFGIIIDYEILIMNNIMSKNCYTV